MKAFLRNYKGSDDLIDEMERRIACTPNELSM